MNVLEALAQLCRAQGFEGFDLGKALLDRDDHGRPVRVSCLRPLEGGPELGLELEYGSDDPGDAFWTWASLTTPTLRVVRRRGRTVP